MNIKYYFMRIINDRVKLGIIIFFYASMIIQFHLAENLLLLKYGAPPISADYITFLAGGASSFLFQTLLLWVMPVILMLIFCDDCIEDYRTGNRNIMISKMGKRKYYVSIIFKSFLFSFLFFLTMLLLNWSYGKITMMGATSNQFESILQYMKPDGWFMLSYKHPNIVNLLYILGASLLAGIVGASCSVMATVLHNRKLVYPICFVPWFVAFKMRNSITMSIQPFTEYSAIQGAPAYIIVCLAYIAIAVGLIVWEKKNETIA